MSLQIASINSGSNGNCYYIGNNDEAILVDAGISCREMEKRMERMGLSMHKVKAILISHEHADHIFGLPTITRKYKLPVYITSDTFISGKQKIDPCLLIHFNSSDTINIGSITIKSFPKHHDAADPHSFVVSCRSINIGVFTDIGQPCELLRKHFSLCHAAFLEANYDETMLENGKYPWFLKNRIRGGKGHLSNKQAHELFTKCRSAFLSHLFLSHLSRDNNDPELAANLFRGSHSTEIIIASRYVESSIYEINSASYQPLLTAMLPRSRTIRSTQPRPTQLSIF